MNIFANSYGDWVWGVVAAVLVLGVVLGFIICYFLPFISKRRAENKADKILNDAEIKAEKIKKEADLDIKQKIFEMKQEAEKDIKERKKDVVDKENKLNQREQTMNQRDSLLTQKEKNIDNKEKIVETQIEENKKKNQLLLEKIDGIILELEKVANMTQKEAREEIFKRVEEKEQKEIAKYLKEREEEAENIADEKSKQILAGAIFRHAQEVTTERTVNVVQLPNEEMKGRIIGREGRNIKSFEKILGVDIIIDDTPEALTISCFNPIRREIATRALNSLIKDGRIQPGRIEEAAEKYKKEVEDSIHKSGQEAIFKLGLGNVNKELVNFIGRLKYRTSYGQNQLEHSIETAELAGIMAAELGLDQTLAKRAGLLHDLGKACDFEIDGSHVEIGARLAKKYGENDVVVNAIESHHGDVKAKYIISYLVAAADTLSAARPGARSETLETYIKRIAQLEEICNSYDGVQQSFAMQSGREVRVMVIPEKISDLEAFKMAKDIKDRIEKEMSFPGQIKVNVIREYRAIETAK